MEFLRHTEVRRRLDEKRRKDTREKRGEEWGWSNREESEEAEVDGGGDGPGKDMEGWEGGEMERGVED